MQLTFFFILKQVFVRFLLGHLHKAWREKDMQCHTSFLPFSCFLFLTPLCFLAWQSPLFPLKKFLPKCQRRWTFITKFVHSRGVKFLFNFKRFIVSIYGPIHPMMLVKACFVRNFITLSADIKNNFWHEKLDVTSGTRACSLSASFRQFSE